MRKLAQSLLTDFFNGGLMASKVMKNFLPQSLLFLLVTWPLINGQLTAVRRGYLLTYIA